MWTKCRTQGNDLLIVFEGAQSGDLAQLIKQRVEQGIPFSTDEVWLLFGQVCEALAHVCGRAV